MATKQTGLCGDVAVSCHSPAMQSQCSAHGCTFSQNTLPLSLSLSLLVLSFLFCPLSSPFPFTHFSFCLSFFPSPLSVPPSLSWSCCTQALYNELCSYAKRY